MQNEEFKQKIEKRKLARIKKRKLNTVILLSLILFIQLCFIIFNCLYISNLNKKQRNYEDETLKISAEIEQIRSQISK